MPVQVSYPGVYIEELPPGPASITGAPFSVTAFVGPAAMGPVNEPTQVKSFGDFSRIFGGLAGSSPLSYAVQQFFLNGGSTSLIVRVTATDAIPATLSLPPEKGTLLTLVATQAGAAGNAMGLSIAPIDLVNQRYQLTLLPGGASLPITYKISLKDPTAPDYITTVLNSTTPIQVSGAVSVAGLALLQSAAFSGGTDATGTSAKAQASVSGLGLTALVPTARYNDWTVQVGAPVTPKNNYFNLAILQSGKTYAFPARDVSISSADGADYVLKALGDAVNYTGGTALFTASQIPKTAPSVSAQAKFTGGSSSVPAQPAQLSLPDVSGAIALQAKNPGAWGNDLSVWIDYRTNPVNGNLFNLTVRLGSPVGAAKTEIFQNLSTQSSDPNFAGTVLDAQSTLLQLSNSASLAQRPMPAGAFVLANGDGADGSAFSGVLPGGPKQGIYALDSVHVFNLLCIPPLTFGASITGDIYAAAAAYCENRRAFFIADPPTDWNNADSAIAKSWEIDYLRSPNAALFFPYINAADPLQNNRTTAFAPCGTVAGAIARTDAARGVWKSPAGVQATLQGALGLAASITDSQQGQLNPLGINCLRWFPQTGPVVYGARTLMGADMLQSQWKYIAVRRTALYIEDSLYDGLQFAVFEPNAEPLWSQIRLSVGAFLQGLFEQDAFAGRTPQDAYFVQCDSDTNPPDKIAQGIVTVRVGFAPLEPAEFVVVQVQLISGS